MASLPVLSIVSVKLNIHPSSCYFFCCCLLAYCHLIQRLNVLQVSPLHVSPRDAGLHASEDDAGAIGKIVDDTDLTHAGGAAQGGCLVEVSLIELACKKSARA